MNERRLIPAVGALAVGLVGAGVLFALLKYAGREMDILGVLVGAGVGAVAGKLGGRGIGMASGCAVIAVTSILGGKLLATNILYDEAVQALIVEESTEASFEYDKEAAEAFAETATDKRAAFAAEWFNVSGEDEVSAGQLREFEEMHVPRLVWIAESQPAHSEWSTRRIADLRLELAQIPRFKRFRVVTDSEDDIDLLFDLLFIALAGVVAFEALRKTHA